MLAGWLAAVRNLPRNLAHAHLLLSWQGACPALRTVHESNGIGPMLLAHVLPSWIGLGINRFKFNHLIVKLHRGVEHDRRTTPASLVGGMGFTSGFGNHL
jgi:hypothetical protein